MVKKLYLACPACNGSRISEMSEFHGTCSYCNGTGNDPVPYFSAKRIEAGKPRLKNPGEPWWAGHSGVWAETFALSKFARDRHTPAAPRSHFSGTEAELLALVEKAFNENSVKAGYRDGVVLVRVPADGFMTATVTLNEGDELSGKFEARRPGEMPRKAIRLSANDANVWTEKAPAKKVDIILYRHDVLAEDGDASSDAAWEIISINTWASDDEEEPMDPQTLMFNHFHVEGSNDGGTTTNMDDKTFVEALKKSFLYWRNKAMIG